MDKVTQLENRIRELENKFYNNNFTANQKFPKSSDFTGRLRVPRVTATPSTCQIGEVCVVSSTGKLYVCSAANTWSLVGTQS
jgi:hypothetical protein